MAQKRAVKATADIEENKANELIRRKAGKVLIYFSHSVTGTNWLTSEY
jgi:hypothetical protein